MAVHYIQNAIGSAAFSALSANRGASKTLSSTELTDLLADVDSVLAACVANATINALGASTEGSKAVQCIRAAVESALDGVNVRGLVSTDPLMVALAARIAALYTSCNSHMGNNACLYAIGSAAYATLSKGRGTAGTMTATELSNLESDVDVVIAACHANATILALEGGTAAGDRVTQALRAATESVLSGVSVYGYLSSSTVMIYLATQIAALYMASVAHMGIATNYAMNAIGSATFAALSKNRGTSATLSSAELSALVGDVDVICTACNNDNTTLVAPGGQNGINALESTVGIGDPSTQALRAAVKSALDGLDIHGYGATDAVIVDLIVQIETLYNSSYAHMGSTS